MNRLAASVLVLASCAGSADREPEIRRIRHMQHRLATDPDDAEMHLRLGLLWARAGDGLRAQQYLERAHELGADPRRALPPLIRVSLALASWEAALRHAVTLSEELRPGCGSQGIGSACRELAEVLATAAALHDSLGRPGRALPLLEEATRLHPIFADGYLGLARLHERRDDLVAARGVLRRGIVALRGHPGADTLRDSLSVLEPDEGAP